MIQIAKTEKIEIVNLTKADGSDANFMKMGTTTAKTFAVQPTLPPVGQFVIEGDGGGFVSPNFSITYTALHTGSVEETGLTAFDSNFNLWASIK